MNSKTQIFAGRALRSLMLAAASIMLVVIVAGCNKQEATDQTEGVLDTGAQVLDTAKDDINDAVDVNNQQNAEALEIAEQDNSINEENMDTNAGSTPQEIDMALVDCAGATIVTNQGTIEVELFSDKAPTTVANFCTLAKKGFYEDVIFHRVIQGFMIQGGDPTGTGTGGPGYKFEDELPGNGEYEIGSLAMANAGPNTNGSQFFIVSGPNGVNLPPLYTLFGQVTKGLDVVEKIQNVETAAGDKPVEDVIIESVEIR